MIKFEGGPATGVVLRLRRAPIFLRVVIAKDASVDALDQIDEEASEGETIFVYRRQGEPRQAHLCFRGKKDRHKSGWYLMATYVFEEANQPDDEAILQDREKWQAYAKELEELSRS